MMSVVRPSSTIPKLPKPSTSLRPQYAYTPQHHSAQSSPSASDTKASSSSHTTQTHHMRQKNIDVDLTSCIIPMQYTPSSAHSHATASHAQSSPSASDTKASSSSHTTHPYVILMLTSRVHVLDWFCVAVVMVLVVGEDASSP